MLPVISAIVFDFDGVLSPIVADPERWTKITRAASFKRRFGGVEGDSLKRAPVGFTPRAMTSGFHFGFALPGFTPTKAA